MPAITKLITMWTVVGLAAAVMTMFAFVPQIIKIVRTKRAADVSLATIVQMMAGVTLWLAYGIHLADPIIIVANAVTDISLAMIVILHFKYR